MDKSNSHLQIDVWGTAEELQKDGTSIYDLVLAAALKARDISKKRNFQDQKEGKLNKHQFKPINQALHELEKEIKNS